MPKSIQKIKTIHIFFLSILITIAIAACVVHVFFGYYYIQTSAYAIGSDDAFISYRYAYHLFHEHRLCFNSTGCVEGYSNFLYILFMLPAFYFGKNNVYMYSVILNAIFFIACILSFFFLLKKYFSSRDALIGTTLFALNPALWSHVSSGMESIWVLFIFFLFCITLKQTDNPSKSILLIILSVLSIASRVDGFLLPCIATLFLYIHQDKKNALTLALTILISMFIYTIFRLYFYHDIIANTYYAKVTGGLILRLYSGVRHLYFNTLYNGFAFFFFFAFYYFIQYLIEDRQALTDFPMMFFVLWILYFVYIGGDVYLERFLLPCLAIGIYFFVLFLQNIKYHSIKYLLVACALWASFLVYADDGRFFYQKKIYDVWQYLGKFLYPLPHRYRMAIDAAGKIPFYSELNTIDMLGLNNRKIGKMAFNKNRFVIGHNKYNADYIIALRPELICTGIYANLDAGWGLLRKKYAPYYQIKYLLNVTRNDLNTLNLIDVQHKKDAYKHYLIKHGYRYAVLARRDMINSLPDKNSCGHPYTVITI